MLVDSSALVAMTTHESDARKLIETLMLDEKRLCCSIGLWEAARAIARIYTIPALEAIKTLDRFLTDFDLLVVTIGEAETRLAIDAHDRYGKGTGHPARLNMGDCFAYACAKANDARLLYKGDDFSATDLAR